MKNTHDSPKTTGENFDLYNVKIDEVRDDALISSDLNERAGDTSQNMPRFVFDKEKGVTKQFISQFKGRTNFTVYHLRGEIYKTGVSGRGLVINDGTLNKPLPKHTYSRQYFSNQLVSAYVSQKQDRAFKCIANLEEDGKLTGRTSPNLVLKGGVIGSRKIISIKPVLSTKYHFYTLMLADLKNPHDIIRVHLQSKDISKDILDAEGKGKQGHMGKLYGHRILVPDTRKLLPKLPHYLNVLFGGKMTIEEEHTYDKNGKITNTRYGILNIINRQDVNP